MYSKQVSGRPYLFLSLRVYFSIPQPQPVKRPRLSAAVSYDIMNEDYIYLYYISAID